MRRITKREVKKRGFTAKAIEHVLNEYRIQAACGCAWAVIRVLVERNFEIDVDSPIYASIQEDDKDTLAESLCPMHRQLILPQTFRIGLAEVPSV